MEEVWIRVTGAPKISTMAPVNNNPSPPNSPEDSVSTHNVPPSSGEAEAYDICLPTCLTSSDDKEASLELTRTIGLSGFVPVDLSTCKLPIVGKGEKYSDGAFHAQHTHELREESGRIGPSLPEIGQDLLACAAKSNVSGRAKSYLEQGHANLELLYSANPGDILLNEKNMRLMDVEWDRGKTKDGPLTARIVVHEYQVGHHTYVQLFLLPEARYFKCALLAAANTCPGGPSEKLPGCIGFVWATRGQIGESAPDWKLLVVQGGIKSQPLDSSAPINQVNPGVFRRYLGWQSLLLQQLCEYIKEQRSNGLIIGAEILNDDMPIRNTTLLVDRIQATCKEKGIKPIIKEGT